MKQKDIALIVFIVGISAIISMGLTKAIISTPKNRQQKVEVVEPITSEFTRPDQKFFNKDSIDPTQTIQIGGVSNTKPFSGN